MAEVGSGERGRGALDRAGVIAETDGLLTREPGLPLFVSFADCVPVLLVAGRPARALALVHAGWRGMVAGIVAEAARALGAYGAARAAVIGPSIGPCCFAVSPDVGERFEAAFPGTWRDGHVDLWEAARRRAHRRRPRAGRHRQRAGCAPVTTTSSSRTAASTASPAGRRPSPG